MDREKFLEKLFPLIGGKENTSLCEFQDDVLYLTLKDAGLADENAVAKLPDVASATLRRGRLTVTFGEPERKEEVPHIMANNQQIAADVLRAVGGKENVTAVTHCMTRLRFNLKNMDLPNQDEVKNIPGVIGLVVSGGQFQIIIGQNVPKVYEEVCKLGGFAAQAAIEEDLDKPKEKLTLKAVGNNIMNYLSGSMAQLIPVMIASAMFKTLLVILGPDMFKLIAPGDDAYIVLDFLYDAFYYFLPIYLGHAAAKRLGVNQMLGIMLGAILLVPDFVALNGVQDTLKIYGFLPAPVADYSQSIVPVLLGVWLMSYVEKFFKKYIPTTLSTVFTPFLTMAVMVPVMFCVCAPLGSYLGQIIGTLLIVFQAKGGFLATAVVGGLYAFIVMTGMHGVLLMAAMTTFFTLGYEDFVITAGCAANCAAWGMAFGAFLKMKNKEKKSLAFGYFVSGVLGGITEPSLYGIGIEYKKPLIALAAGGFAGALYIGITHVKCYMLGATNFLSFLGFVAGGTANTINYVVGCVIAFAVTAALTYVICDFREN